MTRDTAITKANALADKLNTTLREAEDDGASTYPAQVEVIDEYMTAIVYTSECYDQAHSGNVIAAFQWD